MPLPATEQTSATQKGHASKVKVRATTGKSKIAQILDIQAHLYLRALNGETTDKDSAALACAFERLENRLGRLRMRPEPKPVDTEALAARKRKRNGNQFQAIMGHDPTQPQG
jgi:ribosome-associated translation inhibitor RaiA